MRVLASGLEVSSGLRGGTDGTGAEAELVVRSGHMSATGSRPDEAHGTRRPLFSWTESPAEEPGMRNGRSRKSASAHRITTTASAPLQLEVRDGQLNEVPVPIVAAHSWWGR